jgi:hypothetical protein
MDDVKMEVDPTPGTNSAKAVVAGGDKKPRFEVKKVGRVAAFVDW